MLISDSTQLVEEDDLVILHPSHQAPLTHQHTHPANDPFPLDIPEKCLYGYLGEVARSTDCPLSLAYPSSLAIFAGLGVNLDETVQEGTHLYVFLLGAPGSGKSLTRRRIVSTLQPPDGSVIYQTPVSDRGLLMALAPPKPPKGELPDESLRAMCLIINEARTMFLKMSIRGSTLDGTLCDLWDGEPVGVSDKHGSSGVHAWLSILGNLPASDASELRSMLSASSRYGLFQRSLMCPAPLNWKWDHTWRPTVPPRLPVKVTVPAAIQYRAEAWKQALPDGEERAHLARLALRIATVSASANGDKAVSIPCLDAALALMEWQCRMRGIYQPSVAEDDVAQVTNAVLDQLYGSRFDSGGNFRWSEFCRKFNLYRKYGVTRMRQIKDALVANGDLIAEMDAALHPRPTGYVRVLTDAGLAAEKQARAQARAERLAAQGGTE